MRHWSGAENTEEFIKVAVSEPHPLDNTPTFQQIRRIQEEQALAVALEQLQKASNLLSRFRR